MRFLGFLLVLTASAAVAQAPVAVPSPATDLSTQEKARRSNEALTRMRTALKEVLQKLEEARSTRDMVKLNCVNEKLTQIKGLLRISEQADVSMQEANARAERSTSDHEYTKVTIARSKVEQLRGETEQCIGQLAFRTDENMVVEVEEPEGLPNDPTRAPVVAPVPSRPPPASPAL